MSIGFRLSGAIYKKEHLIETAKKLAQKQGYGLSVRDNGLCFTLCPMGNLILNWTEQGGFREKWLIEGECQSTPAGAGFHKAAVELMDELEIKNLSVDDETEYYEHRDFERMRKEHFYSWLNTMVGICKNELGKKHSTNIFVCWNMNQYQPENIEETVVTPMGRFSIQYLLEAVEKWGIQELAKHFFLWNEAEKDALFYRNKALNALWENCYYVSSDRSQEDRQINRSILNDLERAYQMDPELSLPFKTYRELCVLDGRKPVLPMQGEELETEFPIGYRRGLVTHSLGALRLTLPGSYRYEWEEYEDGEGTNLWWDASKDSPVWRVNGYRIREGEAHFTDSMDRFSKLEKKEMENGSALWGWETIHEGETFYRVECEVITGASLFVLSVTYSQKKEKEGIRELLQKLSVVPVGPKA